MIAKALQKATRVLLNSDAKKATVYLSSKLVVSICRRFKKDRRNSREDFVVKIGAPNYLEVRFIKACAKAKVALPLSRVQLRFWPKARK